MYNENVGSANQLPTVYVIKRSGSQVVFEPYKIRAALMKANKEETREKKKLSEEEIDQIVSDITADAYHMKRALSVEEIQEKVLEGIFDTGKKSVYDLYRDYRNSHADARHKEGIFAKMEGVVEVGRQDDGSISGGNEEVKQENANKNPTVLSVQRDYIAGELSREYTRKYLLPPDIAKAHDEGIIHFHDADYFVQHSHNCELINLEDMLQNGTMISGTKIDTPKSFATACTVTSQIAAVVASNSYGGQTFSLAHLAPFVDVSRQKIRKRLSKELSEAEVEIGNEKLDKLVEKELLKEVEAGCQTIQYQLITLQTTNGQAPFITVFMYLHEAPEGQTREDLALLIRVMLEQRILGVKNKAGAYISPTFPKLIYVLEDDNITEGSMYWDLTVLAAKCTAKRLVPDYISEKVMLDLKGDVYPCMGCVIGSETISYRYNGEEKNCSFADAWEDLSKTFSPKLQPGRKADYYLDLCGVEIYDHKAGWVDCYGMIKNNKSSFLRVMFGNGRNILCTADHPFDTENRGAVRADSLIPGDVISAVGVTLEERTLAVKCVVATNIVDASYDVTTASEHFTVSGIYSHNCRSFLTPDRFTDVGIGNIENRGNYREGEHRYYGRFNQGVVTLNLVDIACSSGGDEEKFWTICDERLDLCHRALHIRHERLKGTPSDVAPILWQDGALARLKPGETIDKLLYHGYSTISLGYAGLAECVYYMTGESHTSEKGKKFGLSVMQALNDACTKWKAAEDIDYSVYGTPLESTTYKFAKCLQRRFGIIPGVTDKNYITNSYHIKVTEEINAFDKLSKEAEFQKLSPGGAISYVEVPNMQNNIEAVLAVMQHIYETILYAELNTKSDYCSACGYDGEIQLVEDEHKKLIWKCPNCGCTDQNQLYVVRRICGYLGGANGVNQGRLSDINDRVLHL